MPHLLPPVNRETARVATWRRKPAGNAGILLCRIDSLPLQFFSSPSAPPVAAGTIREGKDDAGHLRVHALKIFFPAPGRAGTPRSGPPEAARVPIVVRTIQAHLDALEDCVAEEITVTATASFTVPQGLRRDHDRPDRRLRAGTRPGIAKLRSRSRNSPRRDWRSRGCIGSARVLQGEEKSGPRARSSPGGSGGSGSARCPGLGTALVGPLESSEIELLHFEERLRSPGDLLLVLVLEHLVHRGGNDLPGEAVACPSASRTASASGSAESFPQ